MNRKERNRFLRMAIFALAGAVMLCCFPLPAMAADVSDAVYPEGFSFSEGCLTLCNESITIERGYYTDVFGQLKGYLIHPIFEEYGSHGMCYGLAVVNAALLSGSPSADSFTHADGSVPAYIGDLRKGTVEGTSSLPLMSLIRYGYVLQAGAELTLNYQKSNNDAAGLYAAVSDFVYRGGPPVIVGLLGDYVSHEVLAVGLLGEEDIVVCDSNEPTRPYVMDFTEGRWEYSCAGLKWAYPRDSFDYDVGAAVRFVDLTAATDGTLVPEDYAYNAREEESGEAAIRRSGMVPLDQDKLLLAFHEDFDLNGTQTFPVGQGPLPLQDDGDDLLDYCWVREDAVAAARNTGEQPRSLLLADNRRGLAARVPPGGSAAITFSEGLPTTLVTGTGGEYASVALLSMSGEELDGFVAEGVLDGAELYAAETPAGFLVDGLRDISVRSLGRWEDGAETQKRKDGAVLIRGNSDGFTVSLMGDADGDGEVSPGDARTVLRCSVSLEDTARFDLALCDFDTDGELTPTDARLILRRTVGLRD